MDASATKAEFARNIIESHRVMALMRTEARLNCHAIDESRKAIDESHDILDLPDRAGEA
jgi:hypothetical protein